MYINSLCLSNFRNYSNLFINFGKKINVIYGDNAQGKTNILESIYLCASGRSHRTPRDYDLVNFNENCFRLKIEYFKGMEKILIEILYDSGRKKKIRINEVPLHRLGELMGNFNAVIFSPEDLLMIKEGPSERRKFIDIAISQIRPSYFYNLQQYSKVLHHRNNLLKEARARQSLLDTLDVWDESLVEPGSRIMMARNDFIKNLSIIAEQVHTSITDGSEKIELKYVPSFRLEDLNSMDAVKSIFMAKLKKSLQKELEKGVTLWGPQRDDMDILVNSVDVKQYGSQGQQRTAVLSLRLSEARFMQEITGEAPVMLLDDVMSELDAGRQHRLLDFIRERQAFITCTDKSILSGSGVKDIKYIKISAGAVVEQ